MYCSNCGKEINDYVTFCPLCGAKVGHENRMEMPLYQKSENSNKTLYTVAMVFSIITIATSIITSIFLIICGLVSLRIYDTSDSEVFSIAISYIVIAVLALVTLIYRIPMTITISKAIKNKTSLSVAFKVCTLLFLNVISGILLLCASENK